jgi:hypothetical protein
MGTASVQQMADRVAELMEERLRIRGSNLNDKLRRGGRALPRRIRREAEFLAESAEKARNPQLFVRLDHARIAKAYDDCMAHLNGLNRWERITGRILSALGRISVNLLLLVVLVIAFLMWRGLI